MIRQAFIILLLRLLCTTAQAQIFEPVFPGLSGDELLDSVTAHYRPDTVLDYANARDTLYAKVLAADDDTLRCIYSGYALYLDPTQDPTQYVYLNGSSLGMNTEHVYPQGKGAADGNARSDMHHLFPTRIPVNEARGESPFADIPDALTQKWFRGTQVLLSPPVQDRDSWSEARSFTDFEPREQVKGDLARAVFYFYTMYRAQANAADPDFFESQRLTLCQWQALDPADSAELVKTWRIAPYQDGKPNPFVLDCTLARRCWCPELATDCSVPVKEPAATNSLALRFTPEPFEGSGRLEMTLPFAGRLEMRLLSTSGQEIAVWRVGNVADGVFSYAFEIPPAGRGQITMLEARLWNGDTFVRGVVKIPAQ